jgi:hypothetical protein
MTQVTLVVGQLTEALLLKASMYTLSKETSLVRTKNVVQQGLFKKVIPSTSTLVALSVKKRIGR